MKRTELIRALRVERTAVGGGFHLKIRQGKYMLSRDIAGYGDWYLTTMSSSLHNSSLPLKKKGATTGIDSKVLSGNEKGDSNSKSKIRPDQPIDNVVSATSSSLMESLPVPLQPYAQLARFDKV